MSDILRDTCGTGVAPGPASQVAVMKRTDASPGLQCSQINILTSATVTSTRRSRNKTHENEPRWSGLESCHVFDNVLSRKRTPFDFIS
jgi:hypothetical protein